MPTSSLVRGVQDENNALRELINDQSRLISKQQKKLFEIEQTLYIERQTDTAENTQANDEDENDDEVTAQKNKARIPRMITSNQSIAFHALSNAYEHTHVGIHQPILFESVLTNLGGEFHFNHGTFIAPTHGLYLFSVTILSSGIDIMSEMVKDGTVLGRILSQGDGSKHAQSSITIVSVLQAGKEVWVRVKGPADTSYWGELYTSFTGVLLNFV
ncbi:complement C1q-like protein 2 [Mya arenaria]|uniref:complement C1q-like protein 2 n=1 Tax=Mya arenaria TaxID=6604 RepID=UPI0022E15907|nr:complement C1q-like protein 2 [Mya arenaria]